MRILLINPNTYQKPPVIPIGLEYLLTYLRNAGHEAEILDLCFSSSPIDDVRTHLEGKNYDLFGVMIRNIDTCLYYNNEFFLDSIKSVVDFLKTKSTPIVLGGAGFSAMPDEILDFLGADYGIFGPGEQSLLKLINDLAANQANYKIINGWNSNKDHDLVHLRGKDVDYTQYIEKDGVLGFESQKGCPNSCSYCLEANTGFYPKPDAKVIDEIEHLVRQGYHHFHLCDSEFNLNLKRSVGFCQSLIERNLNLKWAVYMKPIPYSEELFKVLKNSKVYLITLSIESDLKEQKSNGYSYADLEKIFDYCKKYEIKLAIDLLIGFPGESRESIEEMINFLSANRPDTVGVNFYFRITKNTKLGQLFQKDSSCYL